MRVHSGLRGMSSAPATPEMIELYLMEEYHWTPKQIGEISYRKIQKLFLMKNQKSEVENVQRSRRELESQQKMAASGRGRTVGYRDV